MLSSSQIRTKFLDFFQNKTHKIVSSAPIVVKNDPTLMFINAGMNQFKDIFLGYAPAKDRRVADTQKCLRVSGKHNDLEEVGHDTYHHTMFEMLGNWSFGDYFKEEAINWAWELLVDELGIDPSQLYATVFEGDVQDNLEKDSESYDLWKNHLPESQILFGNKKDNFWEMGETGPCGASSEIHVDIRSKEEREKTPGSELVNMDHPQVVEIWNLVFIEFNRKANGKLENLPKKHVDTGMGFERLCMVLQGKQSNYDTDVFSPLINRISELSGKEYGLEEKYDIPMRVIADHVRAVAFSIADGQLPSNTGAGYVIRRILRRAIRYGYARLNLEKPFMFELVDVLDKEMGDHFPEIRNQKELVQKVIKEEEVSFLRTVELGLNRLDQIMQESSSKEIDGGLAFELYDTYGFPFDLSQLVLKEFGYTVSEDRFKAEMSKQKERSRSATKLNTDDWVVVLEDDKDEFVGYDQTEASIKITQYRQVTTKKKTFYQLAFNITPFYAEGGGQVGDSGFIENDEEKIIVFDTKEENGKVLHFTNKLPTNIHFPFKAVVDDNKRQLTACNHSATHLLHEALREVLGDHVEQKGSLVQFDHLRFDFSHFQKVSKDEIFKIQELVNQRIRSNYSLEEYRSIPIDEAKEMGAMALFGEKYGDMVRAIKFGNSVELCGGTHVAATGSIGLFKIVHETAVASGIRRIEAISGEKADKYIKEKLDTLDAIIAAVKNPNNPLAGIENIQRENAALNKQLELLLKEKAGNVKGDLLKNSIDINGITLVKAKLELDPKAVKNLVFDLKSSKDNMAVVITNISGSKVMLYVGLNKKVVDEHGLHAGNMVKELAKEIHGGGGGQAEFATAGGSNQNGIETVLSLAEKLISKED